MPQSHTTHTMLASRPSLLGDPAGGLRLPTPPLTPAIAAPPPPVPPPPLPPPPSPRASRLFRLAAGRRLSSPRLGKSSKAPMPTRGRRAARRSENVEKEGSVSGVRCVWLASGGSVRCERAAPSASCARRRSAARARMAGLGLVGVRVG